MALILDLIVILAAAAAAFYCMVLARRLRQLNRLDTGLGAAIAMLSKQVTDLQKALERTQDAARQTSTQLDGETDRAEAAIRRIEILMAALHDLPEDPVEPVESAVARFSSRRSNGRRAG